MTDGVQPGPSSVSPISRRQLLQRGGAALVAVSGAGSVLAACGGSSTSSSNSATAGKPHGQLNLLSWQGYDLPGQMKSWERTHGVSLHATFMSTQTEVQAKIKGGATGYDLITYDQGWKELYTQLGIIQPLEPGKLPNLGGEFPYFQESSSASKFWRDPDGTLRGVPWTWGAMGLVYDSALMGPLKSWYDVLDPKFKGKVAIMDDAEGYLRLSCRILGYDITKLTDPEVTKVVDMLKRFVAQGKGVSTSWGDLTTKLVSGDAMLTFEGWQAVPAFAAQAGKKTLKSTIPKEGSFSFADIWAIPPTSKNPDTAYAWINRTLDPKVNAGAAKALTGGITIAAARKYLDPSVAKLYPYDDLEKFFEFAPLVSLPPAKSDQYLTLPEWYDHWEKIKASA